MSRRAMKASRIVPGSKVVETPEALRKAHLRDGSTIILGGFGLCGIPMAVIQAVKDSGVKDLTVVTNTSGTSSWGLGILVTNKQIKRVVTSYVGGNTALEKQYLAGQVELELTPQGTLAERLRAGGSGVPAFYTPTGAGTVVENGGFPIKYNTDGTVAIPSPKRETRIWNNRKCVLEQAIKGDIALVKAWKADTYGNLLFKGTARNFNPDVAAAAHFTIAEVEEVVEMGDIKPEDVHLPGVYVHAVVEAPNVEKKIECLKLDDGHQVHDPRESHRIRIARRAAVELKDGMNVNLGIGMPTMASNYLPKGARIMLQSENGLLGTGPYPKPGQQDPDLINAGKETITYIPGASIFASSESFAMIRGAHLDLTILGGLEVNEFGDLANWVIPGKMVKGMGGAMDLVGCGSKVIVVMEHRSKDGKPKIVKSCSLPLTGYHCVDMIITDMGVFEVDHNNGLTLIEIAEDTTLEELKKNTGCSFKVSPNLKPMQQAPENNH